MFPKVKLGKNLGARVTHLMISCSVQPLGTVAEGQTLEKMFLFRLKQYGFTHEPQDPHTAELNRVSIALSN